ncbi:tetratricopeptide repeat protein [Halotia branconii]|uniref:Tetratricopeptide repeat protein n=1 Tax=Halotia branconii CENA392 TaxID=1539056 RepID=A0AAJ6NQB2_9CYAN|nr:tetratricopeptide repeat protein [Halotia branconii]WGV24730.1 tetratricopeptide repeat protein [Halotia branconii CENA392]
MKRTVFVKPLSWVTLSIMTAIGISPVLAVPAKISWHSPQQSAKKQPQRLAQFSETNQPERSQLLQQAQVLYQQENWTGAEENLRKFTKKYPKDAFGHFQLGNVLVRQGKSEAAISSYREAIRLQSKYALAYNAIGAVYASQNRWEEAITEYQKALEINPDYGDALANLGEAFWQTNKRNEAKVSLEKALNIFKAQSRNQKVNQVERMLQQMKASDDPGVS